MYDDREWAEKLEALLSGALAVWRVDGRIVGDTARPNARTVEVGGAACVTVERITEPDESYWEVEPATGMPALPYAGIQGMLRAVRAVVAPDRESARLVIGQNGP